MQDLRELFNTNPEVLTSLLNSDHIRVTIKLDGSAFQVYYNEDNDTIEYHKRSNGDSIVGPIIDDYTKIFAPHMVEAIDFFEGKKALLDDYKFLTMELYNKSYALLSVVTKEGELLEKLSDLKAVARKLDIELPPIVWNGTFIDKQKEILLSTIVENSMLGTKEFINAITSMFKQYPDFPSEYLSKCKELEGLVFEFKVGNKYATYKLLDYEFTQRRSLRKEQISKYNEDNKALIEEATKYINDTYKEEIIDSDQLTNLNKNFVKYISDHKVLNHLVNLIAKIPPRDTLANVSTKSLPKDIQALIKRYGKVFERCYAFFIKINFEKD